MQQIINWAILIWAGSCSLIIGNSNTDLRKFLIMSAIIPFLFWLVEGYARRRQRIFILRNQKISDFLNSTELQLSIENKIISNFVLLDPFGNQYEKEVVSVFSNLKKVMMFTSTRTLHLGLILITLVLQVLLYPYQKKSVLPTTNKVTSRQDSLIIENQQQIKTDLILLTK